MADLIPSALIDDVVVVRPDVHGDERGRFVEIYRRSCFPRARNGPGHRSEKAAGALVGLHYHLHQADYWYLMRGTARVVLHDLRLGSASDGVTEVIDLDGERDEGVFIPPGGRPRVRGPQRHLARVPSRQLLQRERRVGAGLRRPGGRGRLGSIGSDHLGSGPGEPDQRLDP